MRPFRPFFLTLGVTIATGVSAQPVPRLDSATRIRVTAPAHGLRAQVATVVAQRADTLWLRRPSDRETVTLTTGEVTRLEVSAGRRRHAGRGAGLGVLAGAAIGAGLGYAFPTKNEDCFYCGDRSWDAAGGAVTGAIAGVVVGAIVGANVRTEQWRLVVAEPVAVAGTTPSRRGGTRLGLRRAF